MRRGSEAALGLVGNRLDTLGAGRSGGGRRADRRAKLLGGLVRNFGEFFGARLLLGVGEAPQFPTGARVVRDWFNQRDRGLATGVFNCASSLGTAIAVPLFT